MMQIKGIVAACLYNFETRFSETIPGQQVGPGSGFEVVASHEAPAGFLSAAAAPASCQLPVQALDWQLRPLYVGC